MILKAIHILLILGGALTMMAQGNLSGVIRDEQSQPIYDAIIQLQGQDHNHQATTDINGGYKIEDVASGKYIMTVSAIGMKMTERSITIATDTRMNITMNVNNELIDEVTISDKAQSGRKRYLKSVEQSAIYAAKKTELIKIDQLVINKAANISRQIYSRVAGLNIWESDGAGVQLGIGGRGLSPSRNANFNTRQNGYDISADALGYPESYYTPSADMIDRIEVVRGAASLQYGTQFGGMLNFKLKEGPKDKKVAVTSKQTLGSFGLFNSFNSIGGTAGKVNYIASYQYKNSMGWRPNSSIRQHMAYGALGYQPTERIGIKLEYTDMDYIAQQPGGLTDAQFEQNPRQSNRERNWFKVDWNLMAATLDFELTDRLKWNNRTFGLLGSRDALGNLQRINVIDFGENRDLLVDNFSNWGNESRIVYRYDMGGLPSTLLAGFRYYTGMTERKQGEASARADADFRYLNPANLEGSDFELPSRNTSLFLENVFVLSPQWSIVPGIRFESITTKADGYYRIINKDLAGNIINDQRIDEKTSKRRSFILAGIGASYRPSGDIELYANVSQNYRAINFNDIRVNVGDLRVDEDLEDERGYTVDLGVRGRLWGVLSIDYSVYHISYDDRIGTTLLREPNPVFNGLVDRIIRYRSNIADAKIYGLETLTELDVARWIMPSRADIGLSAFLNLSLTQAKYTSGDNAKIDGNDVELVPPFLLRTGINANYGDLGMSIQYHYTSEHFSDASNAIRTPSAIEGIIPSYSVMDLSMSYSYGAFTVDAGINNLLDRHYFTRRATGYPGPGIIPSDGRSVYLTLGVKL